MPIEKSELNFYQLTNHYLSNASELNLFNLLYDSEAKIYFFNIFRNYIVNEEANKSILYFENHDVDDSEFLDSISVKYYGTPFLWWVICLFNDIENPFEEIMPGDSLKILKPQYLYQLCTELQIIGNR